MDIKEKALQKHYEWGGKLEVISRAPINTREDLSLAYTPGVAQPCLEIAKDPELSYKLTRRSNLVADLPACPLWRASAACSMNSAMWTHSLSV